MAAIPASGAISLSQIRGNYTGATGPVSLSQFYRGGARVPTGDVNTITTSGTQKFSNYRTVNHDGSASSDTRTGFTARQVKVQTGTTTDGLYFLRASPTSNSTQLWCDMNTDGGGWMLIARTYPSASVTAGTWGWRSNGTGSVTNFAVPYDLGWLNWHNAGATFTEYLFGNRLNINNNSWGPFIYKAGISYATFIGSDTQQSGTYSTIKSTLSVYGTADFPGMQGAIGFPTTGTAQNIYYMRDCCGFAGYGVTPGGVATAYGNAAGDMWKYAGPWAMDGSVNRDGAGNFQQASGVSTNYGGTNQAMIMVR